MRCWFVIDIQDWEKELIEIKTINNQFKKINRLMDVFLSAFSLEEALLFRYSPIDHLAEGIIMATKNTYKQISSIRDDVETLPGIYKAISSQCPKYFEGNEFHLSIPRRYIVSEDMTGLLVVPIVLNQIVMGYFCSSKFLTSFDSQKLNDAKVFSKLAGEILGDQCKFVEHGDIKLSKREFEVVKYIAEGFSTKQMKHLLNISEPTIKQYVKSVMDKTNTTNRTHAISYLYRNGILK